jgi:AcrR family transcriptional regulator
VNDSVPELRGSDSDIPPRRFVDELRAALGTSSFRTKGERTRQRLRIAAAEALESEGYPGLKVSDICAGANVAQGTFYVYFRDKAEIAVDVLSDFVDTIYRGVREAARGKDDFDAIHASNVHFIRTYSANRGLLLCQVQMLSQEPAFAEAWLPRHREWQDRIARSIERRTGGRIAGRNALAVATALDGMVFHHLYSALITRNELEDDNCAEAEKMARMLSILWYRAVYARDPDDSGGDLG